MSPLELQPLSSAELSLDISNLVTRLLAGEAVDVPRAGEDLAAKYPDLGMPGELIAKAIARAASMMGVVLEGWDTATAARSKIPLTVAAAEPGPADDRAPLMDQPILVHSNPTAVAPDADGVLAFDDPALVEPPPTHGGKRVGHAVAAVRRAFFGA